MNQVFRNEIQNLRNSQTINTKRNKLRHLMTKYGLYNWQLTPNQTAMLRQVRTASIMYRPEPPRTPNRSPPARKTATATRRTATAIRSKKIKKKAKK